MLYKPLTSPAPDATRAQGAGDWGVAVLDDRGATIVGAQNQNSRHATSWTSACATASPTASLVAGSNEPAEHDANEC